MFLKYIAILCIMLSSFIGNASHVIGGEITWTCQGGDYVFKLVVYRDCNGAVLNTSAVDVLVWGHPTISSINLAFDSSTDVSPLCTQVPGGASPLLCGSGANAGNGQGAIEKVVYISPPITLAGVPPSSGWVFTYENFSRSGSITNLETPSSKGITLISKMFALPNAASGCVDNSPQFLQEPYFVSCAGDPYEYNMNAIDPDLDSLHIEFGIPYDHFPGETYVEGVIPAPLIFEAGFSFNSPTPDNSFDPGNSSALIDPSSGNLTLLSNNIGNYNIKIVAQSFRNGILIAEVSREIHIVISNCTGNNNAPVIAGPFGGLFETTVVAGDLVNFNLSSTDVELLQDGSPQNNILLATGPMFGTSFTSNTGCAIAPCATLDATPLITMSQGVITTFNWQTDCDHLTNPYGYVAESVPYHFVFKIQDDYCPVPKVSYATITINVTNPGIVDAPTVDCIQTNAAGDVTINWSTVIDPLGTFNSYEVHSLQDGLIATIPNINTTTYTDLAVGAKKDYYIASASACNGSTLRNSDTISNIHLDLNNPGNGTAQLQWNDPVSTALASMNPYYHIYREYPLGTWSLYDSVPYGINFYKDTITICNVFLNYQIVLPNTPCDYSSNIQGDNFTDQIAPDIPVLSLVTIDTITNQVTITWNQNQHPDTYGYIIYIEDAGGSIVELDQILGIANNSYTYSPDLSLGSLTYSVAAFDSCSQSIVPIAYNTSAKGELHSSIFLTSTLDICLEQVELSWTSYVGWTGIDHYEVWGRTDNLPWANFGSVATNSMSIDVISGENYTFVVQAFSDDGRSSNSNPSSILITTPKAPAFNYLQVATVTNETVLLKHYIDATANISELVVERKTIGDFEEITRITISGNSASYLDEDVDVSEDTYTYRVQYIDSCGTIRDYSNEAQTILLDINYDDVIKQNYLSWNSYRDFNGSIIQYDLHRGYDSIFDGAAIEMLPSETLNYTDDISNIVSKGKVCYYVEAIESMNVYNFSERSRSNVRCMTLPPIIYIPNAFTPDGVNPVFKPVLSDFDPEDYDFTIFDRWGQVIFKTNAANEGWDGTTILSNDMAATGTYIYMIVLHDADGVEFVKRGYVSLLK